MWSLCGEIFFLIVSVFLVFYTLCQPLVSQTLRFTYPVKGKGVVFTSCSLYLKKKFQYCLQHFLSQIILVVFLNLASVKKLHFSKNYKHLNHILNIFDIYFLYLKIATLRSIKMTRVVTTFVRVSAKLPI